MAIDIKFIAQKAGVSTATVSRVLNNSKKVSEPLRQKVLAEVEKYNYSPNVFARGLISGKTDLIGVIAPNVSDMYHAALISAIEACAEQLHYNVIVSNIYSDFEREKKSFGVFRERHVDGIILMHENTKEELEELCGLVEVPVVLADVNVPDCPLPSVGINDEKAAFDAVSYLIRIGHKNIAGIFGSGYTMDTLRKNGYTKALQTAGLPLKKEWVLHTDCSIKGGTAAGGQLMHLPEKPTAIFCASDEIAIGAMDQLAKLGYSVPGDVSIFGFDNIDLAHIIRPHLTTVNQPVAEIGAAAMRLLSSLIKKREGQKRIQLEHNLVLRASCEAMVPNKARRA